MWTNRLVQCAVLLSLLGLVGAETRAEPMLLMEIHQIGGRGNLSYLGEPIYLAFVTEPAPASSSADQAILDGRYDSSHVGMTFSAAPDVVHEMEFNLRQPTGSFWLDGLARTPVPHRPDDLWQMGLIVDISVNQLVPRLGYGLAGYDLTSVTQTIDRLEYRTTGINAYVAEQEQTIRIYGQLIPEPSSIALLILLHGYVFALRHVRTAR
ncbi:MAG TPA: hypothetical protein VGK58_02215 [Lacipirellulaceae bacterium]